MQSRKLRSLTEEQDAWKQACLHRWDAFLVDRDMQPLSDTPLTWRSAFRYRWSNVPGLLGTCNIIHHVCLLMSLSSHASSNRCLLFNDLLHEDLSLFAVGMLGETMEVSLVFKNLLIS